MRLFLWAVPLVIGALVVDLRGAQAAEFCFSGNSDSPLFTVVHPKNYSKPTRGACKPLNGIEVSQTPAAS